jgi:hypothetical protein
MAIALQGIDPFDARFATKNVLMKIEAAVVAKSRQTQNICCREFATRVSRGKLAVNSQQTHD